MKIFPYVNLTINRTWARMMSDKGNFGIFRNSKQVVPGRWGIYICFYFGVLEIGSRNPRDKIGCLLKNIGLWPW
jgi:hypothetical protein